MTRLQALRAAAGREDGFTLFELLVAMVTGLIVTSAAFALIDVSLHFDSRITDRVDASQLGRTALRYIAQELHSSCVAGAVTPIQALAVTGTGGTALSPSDGTHLQFLTAYGSAAVVSPSLHELSFSGSAGSAGTLTDASYPSTGVTYSTTGGPPTWTFSSTATTRLVASNVSMVAGAPIFSYFAYGANGELSSTPTATPLTGTTAPGVAEVTTNFALAPSSANLAQGRSITLSDANVLRLSPSAAGAAVTPCA